MTSFKRKSFWRIFPFTNIKMKEIFIFSLPTPYFVRETFSKTKKGERIQAPQNAEGWEYYSNSIVSDILLINGSVQGENKKKRVCGLLFRFFS